MIRKELDYEKIGLRIKTLRLEKKILQTDFGKMLGISQTHMSNIENGNAGITLENLVKMASIFACTIDNIVFGEDANGSIALGHDSKVLNGATYAVAIGYGTTAATYAQNAVAIGRQASVGEKSINSNAIGFKANASAKRANAMGDNATAAGIGSIALGSSAKALGENSVALGSGANANGKNSMALGAGSVANEDNVISVGSGVSTRASDDGAPATRRIINVSAGINDTDAVNVSQLKELIGFGATSEVAINNIYEDYGNTNYLNDAKTLIEADTVLDSKIQENTREINSNANAINGLGIELNKLGNRVDKVGAGAAALAALHPLDFDPDDKLSFSAGVGNYGGETATALGAFYRPTEKVVISAAGTMGNGENMVNMGVSFALDRTNSVSNSRTAMAREIVDLREHVARQEQALARQDQQIAQLVAMVNQLTGNTMSYEVNKDIIFPDIPENHWAYEYIHSLAAKGIIEGYPDGNFGGDRTMTRYEFATMLFKAMQKGAVLSEQIRQEFNAELGRIRVDRIKGTDNDANKIERVRVNNYEDRDDYGSKIVQVKAGA